jgi:hypothetical protein
MLCKDATTAPRTIVSPSKILTRRFLRNQNCASLRQKAPFRDPSIAALLIQHPTVSPIDKLKGHTFSVVSHNSARRSGIEKPPSPFG